MIFKIFLSDYYLNPRMDKLFFIIKNSLILIILGYVKDFYFR